MGKNENIKLYYENKKRNRDLNDLVNDVIEEENRNKLTKYYDPDDNELFLASITGDFDLEELSAASDSSNVKNEFINSNLGNFF